MGELLFKDCLTCIHNAVEGIIQNKARTERPRANWFVQYQEILMPLIRLKQRIFLRLKNSGKQLGNECMLNPSYVLLQEEYKQAAQRVKVECRQCREDYYTGVIKELEELFDANDLLKYYSVVGKLVTPMLRPLATGGSNQGIFEDGRLIQGNDAIVEVWARYFKELLNQTGRVDDCVKESLRKQEPVQIEFDSDFDMIELEIAIRQCNVGAGSY